MVVRRLMEKIMRKTSHSPDLDSLNDSRRKDMLEDADLTAVTGGAEAKDVVVSAVLTAAAYLVTGKRV
jgi:hypothetical protein